MSFLWSISILVVPLLSIPGSQAQSDAVCLPFYNWTMNSDNQTPCDVASRLIAVCNSGPFPVLALPDDTHYLGPSLANANPCQCNTVVYSLMSACGACQGKTWLQWPVWATNCATVYNNTFPEPIPAGLHVQGWAYLPIGADNSFDQFLALDNSNITDSSAVPSPTSTSSTPLPTSDISTTTSSSSTSSDSPSTTPTPSATQAPPAAQTNVDHANLVGGVVVGSILGISLLASLAFTVARLWGRRARRLHGVSSERKAPLNVHPAMAEFEGDWNHSDATPVGPSFRSERGRPAAQPALDSISDPQFQV